MFQNFLPNAFGDMREDVNMLIRRDWQKDDLQDQREDAERAYYRNYEAQKEFARHGIQWKVEDALAAGLHPLYALGGPTTGYSPTIAIGSSGGVPDAGPSSWNGMGQDLSRAARATMTEEQRAEHDLRLMLLQAQIHETDARAHLANSQAARLQQQDQAAAVMPPAVFSADQFNPKHVSRIKPRADEVVSTRAEDPSTTAGLHAGLREYTISPYGLRMRLPYSEEGPGEAMENIPFWAWPGMIQHNRSFYGSDWGTRFLKEFIFGQSPKYRSTDPRLRGSSMAPRSSSWFRGRSSGR